MTAHRQLTQLLLGFTIVVIALSLATAWWLTRGDWIFPEQVTVTSTVAANGEQRIGQSFFARQDGLEAIEVRLASVPANVDSLSFVLYPHPRTPTAPPLREGVVVPSTLGEGWLRFSFAPIAESRHQSFMFQIGLAQPAGSLSLETGPVEAYFDGVLYVNGTPQTAQLAFRTVYNRPLLAWGFVRMLVWYALVGVGILLIYVLPGWALIGRLLSGHNGHWVERLALSAALGMAIYPLLILWTDLLNWRWGPVYVWGPLAVGLLGVIYAWRHPRASLRRTKDQFMAWTASDRLVADLALVAVLGVVGIGRLLMVQDLALPLWADSVQHVVIVNRLLETGGLFQSWQPYAPYQTFSLHFGFHANAAVWAWASGMDSVQALLLTAQVMNFVAVLALAPLAYRLGGVWAAVIAVLVAGMFTQFPAYYMNWGRYPQMAGQALLPAAGWWLWMALTRSAQPRHTRALFVLVGAVTAAGMTLGYYRMAFHFMAFTLAALLILFGAEAKRWRFWLVPASYALLTAILFAPWLINFGSRPEVATVMVGSREAPPTFWQGIQLTQIMWDGPTAIAIFLGTLIIVWLGASAALPVIWLWTLVLLPVLRTLPLPGVEIIQTFTIDSSLYIPVALIWGVALGGLRRMAIFADRWVLAVAALLVVSIALVRTPTLLAMVDREYDLSARPDLVAAEWARTNLPSDAVILINGLTYTDGVTSVGGDAGWWLPVLTGHRVTVPPQYALVIEQPEEQGYNEAVNNLVLTLSAVSPTSPEGKAAICAFPQPISHVFLGQRQGMVDKPLPVQAARPMLPAEQLLSDPAFRLLFQHDLSMIFVFDRSICTTTG